MPNKFKKGLLAISVLATGIMATACDVEAELPSEIGNQTVVNLDGITNNDLESIFDALVSAGSDPSQTLEDLILTLSNTQLGTFFTQNPFNAYDTTADKQVKGLSDFASDDEFASFANSHSKAYPNTVAGGATVEGEGTVRAKIFLTRLLTEINKAFMENVGNASYTEDNLFYEELFYNDIKGQLYDLADLADGAYFRGIEEEKDESGNVKLVEVGVNVEASAPFDVTTGYGSNQVRKYFQDDYLRVYKDYILRGILPDVMKKSLVSQYLFDRNYTAFGRSAARKLQYIGLADNTEHDRRSTETLVKAYASIVLADDPSKTADSTHLSADERTAIKAEYYGNLYDLNFLNDLYKGYWDEENVSSGVITAADKIYAAAWGEKTSDNHGSITLGGKLYEAYFNTTFGDYIYDFQKITVQNVDDGSYSYKDRYEIDTDIYNDFTGSGEHSAEVGFELKKDSLITVDNTTEGWFTESTAESLPSTYSSRLFKVTVANDVDTQKTHEDGNDGLDYGYYVNNNYYLSRTSYPTQDGSTGIAEDPTPILIYDSSTWYIIRVDEAVKASKIRKNGEYDLNGGESAVIGTLSNTAADGSYVKGTGVSYRDEIANEIGYMLSDNDSYVQNARQHYVEQAALAYHDTEVYDYFETTFPDLFD